MDIRLALPWAAKQLSFSDSPTLDSEVLLSFVLKKPKEFLFAHLERTINKEQGTKFKKLIQRRAKYEPAAYLTGHKEFYGLDFKVTPAVLIPRPETELIVAEAVRGIKNHESHPHLDTRSEGTERTGIKNLVMIDIGTGSGCIPIAILNQIRKSGLSGYPNINFYAFDISLAALKVARLNARRHGLAHRIKFLQGNLLEPFIKTLKHENIKTKKQENNLTIKQLNNPTIFISANLPYLTTKQWRRTLPDVRFFEPRQALDGGRDGLKYFRELFRQVKQINCHMPSLESHLMLEFDPSQTSKIKTLAKKYFPQASLEIKKDLAGRERLIIINFKKRQKAPLA